MINFQGSINFYGSICTPKITTIYCNIGNPEIFLSTKTYRSLFSGNKVLWNTGVRMFIRLFFKHLPIKDTILKCIHISPSQNLIIQEICKYKMKDVVLIKMSRIQRSGYGISSVNDAGSPIIDNV